MLESILKRKITNKQMHAFHALNLFALRPLFGKLSKNGKENAHEYPSQTINNPKMQKMGNIGRLGNSFSTHDNIKRFRSKIRFAETEQHCPEQFSGKKYTEDYNRESISGIMGKLHEINKSGTPKTYCNSIH